VGTLMAEYRVRYSQIIEQEVTIEAASSDEAARCVETGEIPTDGWSVEEKCVDWESPIIRSVEEVTA
jgi:hypothetical protein